MANSRISSHIILLFLSCLEIPTQVFGAAKSTGDCEPAAVGKIIEVSTKQSWNKGTVRAWNEHGDFWSMPLRSEISKVAETLRTDIGRRCHVEIADIGSFSARITPKKKETDEVDGSQRLVTEKSKSTDGRILISKEGATLGTFSPGNGEIMLILYSAKIAAAIAAGRGDDQSSKFSAGIGKFSQELDIEYNFGDVSVAIVEGVAKLSMRSAAEKLFQDIRMSGYQVGPGSEKQVAMFDGLFSPDHHESFWFSPRGALRVELTKLKYGQVRMAINETRQVPR